MRSVLAPVDLSAATAHQVRVASRLAKALGAALILAHVVEPILGQARHEPRPVAAARGAPARLAAHAARAGGQLPADVRASVVMASGQPAAEIRGSRASRMRVSW